MQRGHSGSRCQAPQVPGVRVPGRAAIRGPIREWSREEFVCRRNRAGETGTDVTDRDVRKRKQPRGILPLGCYW